MRRFLSAGLLLLLFSCATAYEASWKELTEADIPYERAWAAVLYSVQEEFITVQIIDRKAGYLETGWKVTRQCRYEGAKVPCERARAVVSVEEQAPFKVRIKVEREQADYWSSYADWVPRGNDEKIQNKIMDSINRKLKPIQSKALAYYLYEWVCQPQSRRFSGGSRLANKNDLPYHQNSPSFMAEDFNHPPEPLKSPQIRIPVRPPQKPFDITVPGAIFYILWLPTSITTIIYQHATGS